MCVLNDQQMHAARSNTDLACKINVEYSLKKLQNDFNEKHVEKRKIIGSQTASLISGTNGKELTKRLAIKCLF